MIFIKKKCRKCGEERKFMEGSDRDIYSICGNCWDWNCDAVENLEILNNAIVQQ